ncbi:MAG: septum formation inhibitor Maf [Nitrospirae bacterium]|nr:septum formation inhibitor Maf [Nitrospirota bacterium]
MPETRTIILASASPRRRDILGLTGLSFRVDAGDFEEVIDSRMEPGRLARHLSREKARSVAGRHKNAVIIAADTLIRARGKVFGKPRTKKEARDMLSTLSGRVHTVITGFSVYDTETNKCLSRSVETKVYFKRLKAKEIEAYIRSGEPMDKAGAYAIQGLGSVFIKRIDGDYFNVVGLPLSSLVDMLKRFGVDIFRPNND